MSTMRKSVIIIKSIVLLSFTLFSACAVPGGSNDLPAGGGAITAGTTTSASVTVSSNPTSITTSGIATVTIAVKDSLGKPVADGTVVNLTLSSSLMGSLSNASPTTSGGTATALFTASNRTGNVTITATSGTLTGNTVLAITAAATSAMTLSATPSSVFVNGNSTITAHLVDGTGNPVPDGTLVNFSLAAADASKASLSGAGAITTNGDASITFHAIFQTNTTVTVNATAGSINGNIVITITGGLAGGSITVTPGTSSVTVGNTVTVSAKVLDALANPVNGALVTFSSSSTGVTLSAPTATTNSSGIASVTLTGVSPGSVVLTATALSLSGTATISVQALSGSGSINLNSSSASITTFGTATITAQLLDNFGAVVSGATVNFALNNAAVANLSAPSCVTIANGTCSVTLTALSTATNVTVTATYLTLSTSTTVNITSPPPANVSIAVNPSTITVLGTTTITATGVDTNGNPVTNGTPVTFTILPASGYGTLASSNVATANNNGTATTTFTAANTGGSMTVTALMGSVSASSTISISPAPTGSIQFLSTDVQVLGIKGSGANETSTIKFIVKDTNGNPVTNGTAVNFTLKGPGGGEYIGTQDGTPTTATASTVNGEAATILSSGSVAGPITITATTNINSGLTTTLSSAVDSVIATIPVASTAGFPSSGRIKIDNELIDYTGTGAGFTGCTRGASSTTKASHANGATVYGQTSISSSATQLSIGGGLPSAGHWNLSESVFNIAGLSTSGLTATISAFLADRFGNFNILTGTAISFYTEGGSIATQGITDSTGMTTVTLRTQVPSPSDVSRAVAADSISSRYFSGLNEPHYITAGPMTYNPRDGWVTILATTMGEEAFYDVNGNGLYDAGEPFTDLGEPFYDKNDDGCWNDGATAHCPDGTTHASADPFEQFIDTNGNNVYDGPNGVWDGPGCIGSGCQNSKMIWQDIRIVFTNANSYYFWPMPDGNRCYTVGAYGCTATYAVLGGGFAQAPTTIQRGGSGTFTVIVGDGNLNTLPAGTIITASATAGTVAAPASLTLPDVFSNGPTVASFIVDISSTETKTSTTVKVSLGGVNNAQVTVPIVAPPLVITTTVLSPGKVGTAYSSTIVAKGGTSPYSWWYTGALPTGISLGSTDGKLSGTPTASGTSNFTIFVMDADGTINSQALALVINP